MKLIDTNIIIYALGVQHPYKAACVVILNEVAQDMEEYAVDAEGLQEVMYVLTRRSRRQEAINRTRELMDAFKLIIPIGPAEIGAAIVFLERYPSLSPRDAIHAAVAQLHGLEGIVSTDTAFDQVPGLRRYDPAEMVRGQSR